MRTLLEMLFSRIPFRQSVRQTVRSGKGTLLFLRTRNVPRSPSRQNRVQWRTTLRRAGLPESSACPTAVIAVAAGRAPRGRPSWPPQGARRCPRRPPPCAASAPPLGRRVFWPPRRPDARPLWRRRPPVARRRQGRGAAAAATGRRVAGGHHRRRRVCAAVWRAAADAVAGRVAAGRPRRPRRSVAANVGAAAAQRHVRGRGPRWRRGGGAAARRQCGGGWRTRRCLRAAGAPPTQSPPHPPSSPSAAAVVPRARPIAATASRLCATGSPQTRPRAMWRAPPPSTRAAWRASLPAGPPQRGRRSRPTAACGAPRAPVRLGGRPRRHGVGAAGGGVGCAPAGGGRARPRPPDGSVVAPWGRVAKRGGTPGLVTPQKHYEKRVYRVY